jgi:hypothetical protein
MAPVEPDGQTLDDESFRHLLTQDDFVRLDCECGYRRVTRFVRHTGLGLTYWAVDWNGGRKRFANDDIFGTNSTEIRCPNPRCGRKHSVSRQRLQERLDSAVRYGRKVLVLGDDL